jgi:hypothetical protein
VCKCAIEERRDVTGALNIESAPAILHLGRKAQVNYIAFEQEGASKKMNSCECFLLLEHAELTCCGCFLLPEHAELNFCECFLLLEHELHIQS